MNHLTETEAQEAHQRLTTGCDDMTEALRDLLNSKKEIAGQIHSLRKLGKTLRGGFTLFGLGKTSSREVQAIGRLLSERRDAISRRNTWAKLEWKPKNPASRAIVGLLNQQVSSAGKRPPKAAVQWAIARVSSAKESLGKIKDDLLVEQIRGGLETLLKNLQKRSRRLDSESEEDFHDARKALKAYLGAIKFLPERARKIDPEMNELADVLGDENDLATLSLWLDQHGFTNRLEPELWEKITQSRGKLQEQAIKQITRLGLGAKSRQP